MTETVQLVALGVVAWLGLLTAFGLFCGSPSAWQSFLLAGVQRTEAKERARIEIERIKLEALQPYKDGAE